VILTDEQATRAAGAALAPLLRAGDVVLLDGPLGAGKTTLVRGLLAAMGHAGEVPSPSFAIVQPYDDLALPVWHVDLYRIVHSSDLDELGLETIRDDGVLVVEWPGNAGPAAWPATALALSLAPQDDATRVLTATPGDGWGGRWPPR
jgi:tRNA threonylcarbamoyladenosine biosynthesis protein TsaE